MSYIALLLLISVIECWQVLKVIELLYQYVKMLRISGPQEWVFKELQAMGMMEFRFAEEESADQYVVRLACACPLSSLNCIWSQV
jgi:secreted Zn-dependent insulinase-like peptidase